MQRGKNNGKILFFSGHVEKVIDAKNHWDAALKVVRMFPKEMIEDSLGEVFIINEHGFDWDNERGENLYQLTRTLIKEAFPF